MSATPWPARVLGDTSHNPTGTSAFVPKPLPPDPPLEWDDDLLGLLSEADVAVGRLDGLARDLPNPGLFVTTYVRQEAVLSSQIEGTQSSLDDVLAFEITDLDAGLPTDVTETVNCVRALNEGLRLLEELPLSGRLIRGRASGTDGERARPRARSGPFPPFAELDRIARLHPGDGPVRAAVARRHA